MLAAPVTLLYVNVLIALVDPQHLNQEPAYLCFQAKAGIRWSTCSPTQNALLRMISNFSTPNISLLLAAVMPLLRWGWLTLIIASGQIGFPGMWLLSCKQSVCSITVRSTTPTCLPWHNMKEFIWSASMHALELKQSRDGMIRLC